VKQGKLGINYISGEEYKAGRKRNQITKLGVIARIPHKTTLKDTWGHYSES